MAWRCARQAGVGKRWRRRLPVCSETILKNRVLDFASAVATEAASLGASRRENGRAVDMRDTQIAGIVLARCAAPATRNVRYFEDLKIPIVDPWAA